MVWVTVEWRTENCWAHNNLHFWSKGLDDMFQNAHPEKHNSIHADLINSQSSATSVSQIYISAPLNSYKQKSYGEVDDNDHDANGFDMFWYVLMPSTELGSLPSTPSSHPVRFERYPWRGWLAANPFFVQCWREKGWVFSNEPTKPPGCSAIQKSAPFYGHSMMGCPRGSLVLWTCETTRICWASVAWMLAAVPNPCALMQLCRRNPTGLSGGKCWYTFHTRRRSEYIGYLQFAAARKDWPLRCHHQISPITKTRSCQTSEGQRSCCSSSNIEYSLVFPIFLNEHHKIIPSP